MDRSDYMRVVRWRRQPDEVLDTVWLRLDTPDGAAMSAPGVRSVTIHRGVQRTTYWTLDEALRLGVVSLEFNRASLPHD